MASLPPRPERRRPRRGSLERPINARSYRGTWLLVAIPLLIAAFSVKRAPALPLPSLPPAFDTVAALDLADELAGSIPDRRPGTDGGNRAARWVAANLQLQGFATQTDRFEGRIPGHRRVAPVPRTTSSSSPRTPALSVRSARSGSRPIRRTGIACSRSSTWTRSRDRAAPASSSPATRRD